MIIKSMKLFYLSITTFQYAVELFKAAQNRSNKPNLFQNYVNIAQRNLTEAKKDNDFIYHERIPDVKSLEPIGKASVAKLLNMPETFSSDFKGQLVLMIILLIFNLQNCECRNKYCIL